MRLLFASAVISVTIVVLLNYVGTSDRERIEDVATTTQVALCAFKADLEQRASANRKLLDADLGDPLHIYGLEVPRSQLESNLANQERSLASLSALTCS